MSRPITNELGIRAFLHCGLCLKELPADKAPVEWARLSVGWTPQGLQVWCERHGCNVVHIDFEGRQHPACTTRRLERGPVTVPCGAVSRSERMEIVQYQCWYSSRRNGQYREDFMLIPRKVFDNREATVQFILKATKDCPEELAAGRPPVFADLLVHTNQALDEAPRRNPQWYIDCHRKLVLTRKGGVK